MSPVWTFADIVLPNGNVSRAYVNPDFRYRMDPEDILQPYEASSDDSGEVRGPIARSRQSDERVGSGLEWPSRDRRKTDLPVDLHPFNRSRHDSFQQGIASRREADSEAGTHEIKALVDTVDAMAKPRHDAGSGAQLAQSPASAAPRPLDQVLVVKILKHERRLRRQPVGTGHDEVEILSKQRPSPHAIGNGTAISQDDQISVSFQHGLAIWVSGPASTASSKFGTPLLTP